MEFSALGVFSVVGSLSAYNRSQNKNPSIRAKTQ
jgi:hypothetical protein